MASPDFERRTEQVLAQVEAIPLGELRSYKEIGQAVGIVPRYVALIMASVPEVHSVPWHRVVGHDRCVKKGPQATEQVERLRGEGFVVTNGRIAKA